MPQMAPLMWVTLFMMFISLYLINNIKMFYLSSTELTPKTSSSNLGGKSFDQWTW